MPAFYALMVVIDCCFGFIQLLEVDEFPILVSEQGIVVKTLFDSWFEIRFDWHALSIGCALL
jgi:hypothetical protein